MKIRTVFAASAVAIMAFSAQVQADGHAMVDSSDQDMSSGTVTAAKIMSPANGWLVVHRTEDGMKPGPVVGYAPLKAGENTDVTAILTEKVASGDKFMLMLHGEDAGMKTGAFEYTLGAKEDGPVKVDGKLVMKVVTAR
ncbi:MAG: DUF7282 domain-containing protein [Anderseniella sp.]